MNFRSIFFSLLFVFMLFFHLSINSVENDSETSFGRKNKILVLIIASDDQPVYVKFQQIWRSYMHLDPEHVEVYFMKSDPDLPTDSEIVDDTIYIKGNESIIPGIIQKTLASMELFQSRLNEFDYVLRTNLSSFYVFPRLLNFLKLLPTERCYCGVIGGGEIGYVSGAGFLLSPDLVKILIDGKEIIVEDPDNDDVAIGHYLNNFNIPLLSANRQDFLSLHSWLLNKDYISPNIFHFRVKQENPALREYEDIFIQSALLKKFYNITLIP